ncbi:MAG TPA: dTDP-4-dehydrorhamnose 3,5-epimerase, partial [Rikenellaceae bacterium]|nr:dTDP-4-dehydrorhamnose 3,5-epimerase [Rikenellaceae bacterium]
LSEEAVFQYKCDRYYDPSSEAAIAWNDPALGIDWGIPGADILLSEKDMHHPLLSQSDDLFDYSIDYYAL